MKILILILLSLISFSSSGQGNKLTGKKFMIITYELDGHGEWLDFINDSICIRSTGSVSWGTVSDTLQYKIRHDKVYFSNFKRNKGQLEKGKLVIQEISSSEFNEKRKTLVRKYFFQLETDSLQRVIVLRKY